MAAPVEAALESRKLRSDANLQFYSSSSLYNVFFLGSCSDNYAICVFVCVWQLAAVHSAASRSTMMKIISGSQLCVCICCSRCCYCCCCCSCCCKLLDSHVMSARWGCQQPRDKMINIDRIMIRQPQTQPQQQQHF